MNADTLISRIFSNYVKTFTFTLCMVMVVTKLLLGLSFKEPTIWILALATTFLSLCIDLLWHKSRLRQELHASLISPLKEVACANKSLAEGDEKGRQVTLKGDEPEEIHSLAHYRDEMLTRIEELNKTLQGELELAGAMQQALLGEQPKQTEGLELAFQYIPYRYAGGDLYDMVELPSGSAGLLIGDVSGHGVDSAMATMLLKAPLTKIVHNRSASSVMQMCNELLCPVIARQPLFFTLSYALFDLKNKTMHLSLGGHPPPIQTTKEAGCKILEHPGGMIVGKFPDTAFEEREYSYEKGDRFYFYTDGLVEAVNPQGEFFGMENFLMLVCETKTLPLQESAQTIIKRVKEFTHDVLSDDVLLYCIEIKE